MAEKYQNKYRITSARLKNWDYASCASYSAWSDLLLREMSYPAAPFLLGIILGPMADSNLRRALILSSGDPTPFFTRPISLIFATAIILMALSQLKAFGWLKKALVHAELKE